MASHFVALNRGVDGSNAADFVTGTAATGNVFEFRVDDASNARPTDVLLALKSFIRFFENQQQWSSAGFIING
jgi:hypothetical protein